MAGVTGQGTTYNLPNYVGDLFAVTPTDTPFLSAIGGLTGGEKTESTLFQWQGYDLRDANQNTALEGANAPPAEERVRFNVKNVVQIHQEAVEVSYTKLAATGQYQDVGANHSAVGGVAGMNPVRSELDWQIEQMLKQIARDVEFSFVQGTYNEPSSNATARQTKGIIEAIETNVVDMNGVLLDEDAVLDLLQEIWQNGGIQESETATIMANATQKRNLTRIFVTDKGYQESSRTVGGVAVQTIETDFGALNVMLNRHMPIDQVVVVSLEECAPVFLEVPEKGFLFVEPLAKVGAAERAQIYGEIGLKFGNEKKHGKIKELPNSTGYNS